MSITLFYYFSQMIWCKLKLSWVFSYLQKIYIYLIYVQCLLNYKYSPSYIKEWLKNAFKKIENQSTDSTLKSPIKKFNIPGNVFSSRSDFISVGTNERKKVWLFGHKMNFLISCPFIFAVLTEGHRDRGGVAAQPCWKRTLKSQLSCQASSLPALPDPHLLLTVNTRPRNK